MDVATGLDVLRDGPGDNALGGLGETTLFAEGAGDEYLKGVVLALALGTS